MNNYKVKFANITLHEKFFSGPYFLASGHFSHRKTFSNVDLNHFVKSVQIRSFFWSVFSCIQTEYGALYSKASVYLKMINI